ncbi:Uncharacterised protein [Mycobacteroides abscessus subsp. abscessus]|nr:Uncharacterised protein [Mycobacteroides abscessus subsp. abscessus]
MLGSSPKTPMSLVGTSWPRCAITRELLAISTPLRAKYPR